MSYRFDELGWAQFERVCDEILAAEGLEGLEWRGRADETRIARSGRIPTSLAGLDFELSSPSVIAVAWLKDCRVFAHGLRAAAERHSASALLLTNAEIAPEKGFNFAVFGPKELSALIDKHPRVRRRVPSLLGIAELALDPTVTARSSWDVAAARELVRVFVPTRAYRSALDVLDRHKFAVLSGPPEMGKTACARVLGLALHTEGWEVQECIRPEQVWAAYDKKRPQLFIADDAFGSTEYRPDAAERWAVDLDRILRAMDERHWLVWTSRPAPLKAGLGRIHREHGVERFPRPAEVYVDATALDVEERATILFRHARTATLDGDLVKLLRAYSLAIVDHEHFTPERIRRFVANRLPKLGTDQVGVYTAIVAEIAEPTTAMAESFDALGAEHRALLIAMLDTPPGPVAERDLAASARRHAEGGLSRPPAEIADRLTDHFLRIVPPSSATWVHPSWRDLVIDRLAADPEARRCFLERCSIDGVLLALSHGGGRAGERSRPLLHSDADWDALDARIYDLVPDLDDPGLTRLLNTLESGMSPNDAEFVTVARTALDRMARCWDSKRSFPSRSMIRHWHTTAGGFHVRDRPTRPMTFEVWEPRPAFPFTPPPDPGRAPIVTIDWEREIGSPQTVIVDRILADLDAA
jgi:hypothetical protein